MDFSSDLAPLYYDPIADLLYGSKAAAPKHARARLQLEPPAGTRVLGVDLDGLSMAAIDCALGQKVGWCAEVFHTGGEQLLSQEIRLLLRDRPPKVEVSIGTAMLTESHHTMAGWNLKKRAQNRALGQNKKRKDDTMTSRTQDRLLIQQVVVAMTASGAGNLLPYKVRAYCLKATTAKWDDSFLTDAERTELKDALAYVQPRAEAAALREEAKGKFKAV